MKNFLQSFTKQNLQLITRTMIVMVALGFFGSSAFSQITGTTSASRCGEGPLILHATVSSGTITWYAVPFYGTAITVGISDGGATFTTPSLSVTTTYFVDAVDGNGCSLNTNQARWPVIATISANSIQAAIFYASTTFCNSVSTPQQVTRTGTAGGTYTASPSGLTLNPSTGAIIPSTSTNGTYTVTYTVVPAEGCIENPASTVVTITTAPVSPAISYSGSPFCTSADQVPVLQTGATGGTYSASPSGLSINSSNGTITPASSLSGTYTITYFVPGTGGCTPMTTATTITITALPTAFIVYSGAPFCKSIETLQTPVLTGTGAYTGGTYGYTGLGSLTSFSAVTGSFYPSTSGTGTYTITYTVPASGNCSTVAVTTSITINILPTASISGDASVCQGTSSPNITFTGTGTAPFTFTYTVNGGGTQTVTTTSGNSVDVAQPTVSAGTYVYTLTNVADANGCSQIASGIATITITGTPVATFVYTGTPYCKTGLTTPNFTGGGTAGTFSSNPIGVVFNTGGVIDLGASPAGTYTITNTLSACGGVTATAPITINQLPTASISGTLVACATTTLTATTNSTSPQYEWDLNAAPISGQTASTLVATLSGSYTVKITDGATGCTFTSNAVSVTINPYPIVSITGTDMACVSTTLTAVNDASSPSFIWYNNGVAISEATNSTLLVTGTGSYTVQVTNTVTGCATTSTATNATINPLPTATITGPATPNVCAGSASPLITFTGATGQPPYTFTYHINSGSDLQVTTVSGSSVTVGAPTDVPGTFTYTLTNVKDASLTACQQAQTGSVVIIIYPNPIALVLTGSTICTSPGGTGIITSSTSVSGVNYQLYNSGNTAIGSAIAGTGSGLSWTALAAGTGYYVIGTDATTACVTPSSNAVDVSTYANPTITTDGILAAVCFSTNAQTTTLAYTATTNSPTSYSIAWVGFANQGNTAYAFSSGVETVPGIIIPAGTVAGIYSGTMTLTNDNGCTAAQAVTVTVTALPVPTITVVNNCNATATLTATGYTGSLLWSTAETTSSITISTNGTYTVTQTLACTSLPSSAVVTLLAHSGTEWYVSTSGNDANIGTSACPFATIQHGINSANTSDVIQVAAGTYPENIQIFSKSGLTIQGAGDGTLIDGTGYGIEIDNSSNTTIKNLKIITNGPELHGIYVDGAWVGNGRGVSPSNNLTIQNTTINATGTTDHEATGIYGDNVTGGAHTGWLIDHNTITADGGGIGLEDVTASTVSNNISTITNGTNILWITVGYNLADLVISGNTVNGSGGSQISVLTDFPSATGHTIGTVTVSGNTFDTWGSRALRIGAGVSGVTVNQNKFLKAGEALKNEAVSSVNAINNYWGNPTGPYNLASNPCGLGSAVSNNVTFSPWWTTSAMNVSGTAQITAAPVITGPICNASTSVSGTSTEANGTVIEVFIGGSTQGATTVTSGAWTKSLAALTAGNVITASATATGKCVSVLSGSVTISDCSTLAIGATFGGGKVAYILQSGDLGWVSGETHGLIAATADQATNITWSTIIVQCYGTNDALTNCQTASIYTNATAAASRTAAQAIGMGQANTNAIIARHDVGGVSRANYAAGVCDNYINADNGTGVYTDWYLPSKDELNKLWTNLGSTSGMRTANGFANSYYWSSSEYSDIYAWNQTFTDGGSQNPDNKFNNPPVRAIRSF